LSEEASGYIAPEGQTKEVKGNEGDCMKQESGELVGEHMVQLMSTTLSENRQPKQLFVHVGADIIAPITAPALASFSDKHIDQDTCHRERALFRFRFAPGIVFRDEHKGYSTELW
jgi:hypothetical protein